MNYGICDQALVPVRVQPGDREEMVNQLLFGDLVIVKGQVRDWLLIETFDDRYEGWVDQKQLRNISKEVFNSLIIAGRHYALDLSAGGTFKPSQQTFSLTLGASLPDFNNNTIRIEDQEGNYSGKHFSPPEKPDAGETNRLALRYLGAPYLWGGRSPFGIDCSGFVQIVYKMIGIMLPRDASQQVIAGEPLNFVSEAMPGDLAFFGDEEGQIVHVGIIMADHRIIHASGRVRIDRLDHQGIFNEDIKKYTHTLRLVKRMINESTA